MSGTTPPEVTNGTIIYFFMTLLAIMVVWGVKWTGGFNKDDAQVGTVVAVLTGFFAWLFWLCAWMHQWHPLIVPEWKEEE